MLSRLLKFNNLKYISNDIKQDDLVPVCPDSVKLSSRVR